MCLSVCLSEHAILAVRAIRIITKDAIVLSVRFVAILSHMPLCVCVCVCLGGEGSERIWNKCEKGKGKEVERRLSASVMNSPSPFVHG